MKFLRKNKNPNKQRILDKIPAAELEGLQWSASLEQNAKLLKEQFQKCNDIILRNFQLELPGHTKGLLVYVDGLVDKDFINKDILKMLMSKDWQPGQYGVTGLSEIVRDSLVTLGEIKSSSQVQLLVNSVLSGEACLLLEGSDTALIIGVRNWQSRAVAEPDAETVIRGPKEGFVETLRVNTSLIRRRIKSPKLKMELLEIGSLTKTAVTVAYIEGLADPGIVREVWRRLARIDIDGVLESGYLESFIQDTPYSPFPQVATTERPDKVSANLLEGRVAIITDGTPIVMTVPTVFVEFLQASEDYYERWVVSSFIRFARFLGLNVALLLPSLYISLTTFHQEMLPTPLLISVASQREGVPFPALAEALLMELAFEMIREAAVRMPRSIGQTVSIVGALIIGQAAVSAGLVSALMVIIVGITAIASFSMPTYAMANSLRLLRFPLMLLAGFLGLFGVVIGLLAILIHLCSLRSFGVPYLAPIAPFAAADMKDVIVRLPWWMMIKRPGSIKARDVSRQPAGQKPRPPVKKGKNNG